MSKFNINVETNTEEALRENQRFLSTLISNLPGYVYRVEKDENSQWIIVFVSDGIYELTGYPASDFLKDGKMPFGWLVHPEDKALDKDIVIAAIKNKKPYQITYRINTSKGKTKWVWEQGRGVYSESGEMIATEGFITDITEKKLVEEEILKRNEELAILNHIGQTFSKLVMIDEIIDLIFEMIGKLIDNKNLYIGLYNEDKDTISFPVYTVDGIQTSQNERTFGKGLTEFVIKTCQPLLIEEDIENAFRKMHIEQRGKKSKSLISVPIMTGEKVFGVITLQDYNNEHVYTYSQMELLMTIASQTAIALENTYLFTKLEKELDEKKQTEIKIKASLREKELLLQEVHHRVKNNLQIMSSLLRLQSSHIKNEEAQKIFLESENRIKAMAIVHNKLYNAKNYENIDFKDYIKTLTNNLFLSYGVNTNLIYLDIRVENIEVNIDTAIPCGLIINELVSNSLKYAFPDKRSGRITISLKREENQLALIVKDDGVGFEKEKEVISSNTLGMKLVQLLTGQLDGKLEMRNCDGAEFRINFKELSYKKRTI
ncbi:MAG: PAS domain S-box protein [Ignavibacteriae bacterium]|nr:MAG: PAS domain S-box protein [Ignavibacteriota bacterium]